MAVELEDLRHEKELQREEIQKLQGQVQTLKVEIQVRGYDSDLMATSWVLWEDASDSAVKGII